VTLSFRLSLKFTLRWPLAANVNIYFASAHALANRRRRAANLMRVQCRRQELQEGDHVSHNRRNIAENKRVYACEN